MPTVFLSYRRSDAAGEAGRLADTLQRRLGKRFVFRDVDSISPGDQFDSVLDTEMADAALAVVLIGPGWLEEINNRGDTPNIDYHRAEVAAALRGGKRIIPVLLKGATLPPADSLPEDLRALVFCHAITIREEAWKTDVERLIDAMGRPYPWRALAIRVVIALVGIILAVWKVAPLLVPDWATDYRALGTLFIWLLVVYGLVESVGGYRHFRRLRRLRRSTRSE